MLGFIRVVVAQNERALKIRNEVIADVLDTGVYRFFDPFGRIAVQTFELSTGRFEHSLLEAMIADQRALFDRYFDLVETGEEEIGLVYFGQILTDVVRPRTRAVFVKQPLAMEVSTLNLGDSLAVPAGVLRQVRRSTVREIILARSQLIVESTVAQGFRGLLFVDGQLLGELDSGTYGFFKVDRPVTVEMFDMRRQNMEVSGQEILTRDKVTLRVNLSATYRITDPTQAVTVDGNVLESLYRELQFALRTAISAEKLDSLLASKSSLDETVMTVAAGSTKGFGLVLESVGIKDIILPGEMRDLMNQVVEAEKAAQANVIRRREETAATRSLLNTAKLMADNPTLLRLKEMETLESVVQKVDRLTVYNGLEGILSDTIKLGNAPN